MSAGPPRLVLASGSPRRRELLARLGLEFAVDSPDVDEQPAEGETPEAHVARVADAKARAVAERHPGEVVVAADTVVVLGGRIFGKPASRSEAAAMLAALAGRTHTVLTAVTVRWGAREARHLDAARVTMAPHDAEICRWYVATGETDDKAGAYAVQGKGALLVERVEGNVQAVMGLPLAALPGLLAAIGVRLLADGGRLALNRLA